MAYKFNIFTGTFDDVNGSSSPGSSNLEMEFRTISVGEAAAKSLTLTNTPVDITKVALDVIGGGAQMYGEAYTVVGTTLSWNGLDLDGILSSGDKIRIIYSY